MSYFNKKEDVMTIELTPYGRSLLMKGELKPEFYSFFDDDILYDSEAGGFFENNADTKTRILTNTPSLKPQTTIKGVDELSIFNQVVFEGVNVLQNPIGANKLTSQKANAWEVTTVIGEISSSSPNISNPLSPFHNIPQVECELNFTMSVGSLENNDYDTEDYITSELADDGTFVILKTESLLLHILEKNGFVYKDSLSCEVYKFALVGSLLNKLTFSTNPVEDLITQPNLETDEPIEFLSSNQDVNTIESDNEFDVENYFFLAFDEQISRSSLCKGVKKLKEKNIYLGFDIDCEEFDDQEVNIYQTEVTEADIEDCEI